MSGSDSEIYHPLPPQHIRILRLGGLDDPDNQFLGNQKEHLFGHLEAVSLQEVKNHSDDYVALSYCWRRPIPDPDKRSYSNILFGYHLFNLQPNLFAALRNLARLPGGPRAIWADAICIDQSNVEEKNQQVALMGEIYRSVGKVIVWLGPEGDIVRDVFTALSHYANGKDLSEGGSEFFFESEPESSASSFDSSEEIGLEPKMPNKIATKTSLVNRIKGWFKKAKTQNDETRKDEVGPKHRRFKNSLEQLEDSLGLKIGTVQPGLAFLHKCGWFNRTWTFQEISLAMSAVIRVGNSEIPWNDFVIGWRSGFVRGYESWRDIRREIRFIQQARRRENDLLFLLRCIWSREATDLRDKAYGVLGLLNDDFKVVPDYNLSIREAYVRISRAVIEKGGSLDLLHFSGLVNAQVPLWGPFKKPTAEEPRSAFDEDQDGTGGWHLPSWVPDFGSPRIELPAARRRDTLMQQKLPQLDSKFRFDVHWEGEMLVAAGFALGRLVQVESPHQGRPARIAVMPFPACVFDTRIDNWAVSHNLGEALKIRQLHSPATKTNIGEFVRKVHEHDIGHCDCAKPALDDSGVPTLPSHEKGLDLEYQHYEAIRQPLDWMVMLFGARSPVVLRSDYGSEPYGARGFRSGHRHATDGYFSPSAQQRRSGHTFVLIEAFDKETSTINDGDWGGLIDNFRGKVDRLGCLSLVYGDFSLR